MADAEQAVVEHGAATLPADVLERVLGLLELEDRARCELACRHWLAVSRSSTTLWRAVQWDSRRHPLDQLRWLGGRGPVQQAELLHDWGLVYVSACAALPTAACTLRSRATSLQRVRLCITHQVDRLGFLGSLRQLTWLQLDVWVTTPPRSALAFLSGLHRLHTLDCKVSYSAADGRGRQNDDDRPTAAALALLPASLRHLRACETSLSEMAVGQLMALQTLACRKRAWYNCGTHFPALGALGQLTALVLSTVQPVAPDGLSGLTSLRYLDASHRQEGGEGAAVLAQLRHLPRLEWLCLEECLLQRLPGNMPTSLRVLDVAKNRAEIPADAPWLATLEQLACSLYQLPSAGVLANAHRLRRLCLVVGNYLPARGSLELTVLSALGTLQLAALPALETVHFCSWHSSAWEEMLSADLATLSLTPASTKEAERLWEVVLGPRCVNQPRYVPALELPDVEGLFQFPAAD